MTGVGGVSYVINITGNRKCEALNMLKLTNKRFRYLFLVNNAKALLAKLTITKLDSVA